MPVSDFTELASAGCLEAADRHAQAQADVSRAVRSLAEVLFWWRTSGGPRLRWAMSGQAMAQIARGGPDQILAMSAHEGRWLWVHERGSSLWVQR